MNEMNRLRQAPPRYYYGLVCVRCFSSGLKAGRNCIQGVQFSRVLKSSKLTHAVVGKKDEFRELDELLERVPRMPEPRKGYQNILKMCAENRALAQGKRVHAHILREKANASVFICNLLVQMYSKCGCMELAKDVFSTTVNRNEHSWNAIIAGYVQNGEYREALELYEKMNLERMEPNKFIYASALAACSYLGDLDKGSAIHERILWSGMEPDVVVENALVTMYARCGDMNNARRLFNGMAEKNLVSWNAMISACVQQGRPKEALELYTRMEVSPNSFIFASVLTACSMIPDLELGRKIHRRLVESELKTDMIVQNALMNMYGKSGQLDEAYRIFQGMRRRDVCTWTALITSFAKQGHSAQALQLFHRMRAENVQPNSVTFSTVIAGCSSWTEAQALKEYAVACGCDSDPIVQTALLGLYGRFGQVDEAKRLFDSLQSKDVVSWSSMISAYSQNGYSFEALCLYKRMISEGVEPNPMTFTSVISACTNAEALEEGRAIHARLRSSPCKLDVTVQNALVRLYCKCASLEDARDVFDKAEQKDVLTWGSMISAYVQHGLVTEALEHYLKMDVEPDEFVLASAAAACSSLGALEQGRAVHARATPRELSCGVLGTSLLDMYVKCGSLEEAWTLFHRLGERNVYAWTVMIGAYAQTGDSTEALKLFRSMQLEGVEPNVVTFASVLPAFSTPAALKDGKELHARLVAMGEDSDSVIVTTLIVMYSKSGSLKEARELFERRQPQELYTWNALISSYNQHGLAEEALKLYKRMLAEDEEKPNGHTFAMALHACACLGDIEEGRKIHRLVRDREIKADFVQNALVTMYSRCGKMDDALKAFESISDKSVISWTAMISSYLQNGHPREAVGVYQRMDKQPDEVTYACVLNACASAGLLECGKEVHARITAKDITSDYVKTAIANMYAKCGAMVEARKVFDKMARRDTVSWNAIITAYAQHGQTEQVLELYRDMALAGVNPDGITFISILVSCGHAGKTETALDYFNIMTSEHHIPVMADHYQCVTDLLARSGHLTDAEEFISSMKARLNAVPWLTLLSACKDHGDEQRGKRAAEKAFNLDPVDTAPYILLSNIYAETVTNVPQQQHDETNRR